MGFPNEAKAVIKVLETPDKEVKMQKIGMEYVVTPETKHGVATLQIEYLPKAILSKKVTLAGDIKFLQLKYRSWTNIIEDFIKVSYPEQIKPFKVTERYKIELELSYDSSSVIPNNTFVVLQHKSFPKVRSVYHMNPANLNIKLNFSDPDALYGLNGEYEMKIVGKSGSLTNEWNVGNIVVELSTGATGYTAPQEVGAIQGKEIRHVFAPELVYAPFIIALPVGIALVVILLVFMCFVSQLHLKCNNWPKDFSGRFCSAVFIVYFVPNIRPYSLVSMLCMCTFGLK